METNDERRLRKLVAICQQHGRLVVADRAEVNEQTLYQIIERKMGSRMKNPKQLGDDIARKIEAAFDLGRGWFDWPFDAVDHRRYYALNPIDQATVQGELRHAIKDCESRLNKQSAA